MERDERIKTLEKLDKKVRKQVRKLDEILTYLWNTPEHAYHESLIGRELAGMRLDWSREGLKKFCQWTLAEIDGQMADV